jgi:hypothetical protein
MYGRYDYFPESSPTFASDSTSTSTITFRLEPVTMPEVTAKATVPGCRTSWPHPTRRYISRHSAQSGATAAVPTDLFGSKAFTDTIHTDHQLDAAAAKPVPKSRMFDSRTLQLNF